MAAATGTASAASLPVTNTSPTSTMTISSLTSTSAESGAGPAANKTLTINAKNATQQVAVPELTTTTVPTVSIPTPPAPILPPDQTSSAVPVGPAECVQRAVDCLSPGIDNNIDEAEADLTTVEANVDQYYNYLVQVLDSTTVGGCTATNVLTSCFPDFPEVDGALATVESDAQDVITDLTSTGSGALGTAEDALSQAIQSADDDLGAAVDAAGDLVNDAQSVVFGELSTLEGQASDAIGYAQGLAGTLESTGLGVATQAVGVAQQAPGTAETAAANAVPEGECASNEVTDPTPSPEDPEGTPVCGDVATEANDASCTVQPIQGDPQSPDSSQPLCQTLATATPTENDAYAAASSATSTAAGEVPCTSAATCDVGSGISQLP